MIELIPVRYRSQVITIRPIDDSYDTCLMLEDEAYKDFICTIKHNQLLMVHVNYDKLYEFLFGEHLIRESVFSIKVPLVDVGDDVDAAARSQLRTSLICGHVSHSGPDIYVIDVNQDDDIKIISQHCSWFDILKLDKGKRVVLGQMTDSSVALLSLLGVLCKQVHRETLTADDFGIPEKFAPFCKVTADNW